MVRGRGRLTRRMSTALLVALLCAGPAFTSTPASLAPSAAAAEVESERIPDGAAMAQSRPPAPAPAGTRGQATQAQPSPAATALRPRPDGGVTSEATTAPPYHVNPYTIRTLARSALPYVATTLPSKSPPASHDADGIPIMNIDGKLYYSPAGLARYGITYEDAYRRTGDADYLEIAVKVHRKLISLAVRSNGGLYIPYQFSFAMHKISTEVMRPPWYSAMAQGLALSLAVRLHRDTGAASFRADADLLFNSFRHVGRGTNPWVTYIDAGRYLWLEEYPENLTPSDHTANGFNFAIFGLYDYYQLARSSISLQVLRAGLTTMRHYVGQYRIPGSYSKYCLRHGKPQIKYHRIVTEQLVHLYRMSGDSYFLSMSRLFKADYA